MKKIHFVLMGVFALVVVAMEALFVVHQTQQAIVLQFGDPKEVVQDPGLHIKKPFVQNVVYFDRRTLDLDPPEFEILLTDKKRIRVDTYARYRIIDPLVFFQRVQNEYTFRDRFGKIVNSSVRDVLAKSSLIDVLSEQRDDIMAKIDVAVGSLGKSFGVEVVDVRIGRTELPPDTRQAVFSRMQAERDRQARELRAEGAEQGARIRAQADKEKTLILADAKQTADISRGEGEAKRTQILAKAHNQDPKFYEFYRTLQAYEDTLADEDTRLILSPDNAFFKIFKKGQ